jgi:hypothetical protein
MLHTAVQIQPTATHVPEGAVGHHGMSDSSQRHASWDPLNVILALTHQRVRPRSWHAPHHTAGWLDTRLVICTAVDTHGAII